MDNITNKSNYLIKSLETVLNSFCNEDRDDAMCRQRFGDNKWIRKTYLSQLGLRRIAKNF